MAINLVLFGATGLGLLAVGFAERPGPADIQAPAAISATVVAPVGDARPTKLTLTNPAEASPAPAGAYGPDGVFIPAGMTPEEVYAEHDAEVARLMAAMPDDPLIGQTSHVDAETGEETPIDLIGF